MTRRRQHGLVASAVAAAAVAGASSSALAQTPRLSVSVGYSAARDNGGANATNYPRGWVASGAYRIGGRELMAVVEVGQNRRTNLVGERQELEAWLGGVRFDLSGNTRLRPFVQALVGSERFSEPGFTETGVAFQPGGGLDMAIWRLLGARASGDIRLARLGGFAYRELRATASLVVNLGG
jgi:hypothetical protein